MKSYLACAVTMGMGLASIANQGALAGDLTQFKDALIGGEATFDFRYRYEHVDEDNAKDEAHASTLKSRFTYTTKLYQNFQAQVQFDSINVIGSENHYDKQNGMSDHSVVLDPEGSEVNQVWLAYSGIKDTVIKHGRQRINLDNQRFIGGVGWRQNEQTFGASEIVNNSLNDTTIRYAFVKQINGINESNIDTDTHLLNILYQGLPFGNVSIYHYAIEIANDTSGIRIVGNPEFDNLTLHYEFEYARQSEHHTFQTDVDADYWHLVAGATVSGITVKLAQETLGSDDGMASFQTPLATMHKFNGWADKFLVTPANGLQDRYLVVGGRAFGFGLSSAYHDFQADEGSAEYGSELNIAISKAVSKNIKVLLKYADYDADDFSTDTQKLWLQAQLHF